MDHLFVPYKIAFLLKDLGFDKFCLSAYRSTDGEEQLMGLSSWTKSQDTHEGYCLAPTWDQAIQWLIVEHDLHVRPYAISTITWAYHIVRPSNGGVVGRSVGGCNGYKDALSSGIYQALTRIPS